MIVQSMTGFGRAEVCGSDLSVTVELKSVNNRFKDMRFKMPSAFSSLEMEMRKRIGDGFSRGSFDILVNLKCHDEKRSFANLDLKKIETFIRIISETASKCNVRIDVHPTEFLKNEFMKDEEAAHDDESKILLMKALDGAIVSLKEARGIEGGKLVDTLLSHMVKYEECFKKIEGLADEYKKGVEERLRKKITEVSQLKSIDDSRLLQEVIYYLEKLDVSEEINRIYSHMAKLKTTLKGENEVGRQIDFLIQELNRETNTIGSKSGNTEISDLVVQMKVQLEKIREQGLNLE